MKNLKSQNLKRALMVVVLTSLMPVFQNCGISKPRVENGAFGAVTAVSGLKESYKISVATNQPAYCDPTTLVCNGQSSNAVLNITNPGLTMAMPMVMDHATTQVSKTVMSSCLNCHGAAYNGTYSGGVFHASLTAVGAAQPASCVECHKTSVAAVPTGSNTVSDSAVNTLPLGFVGTAVSVASSNFLGNNTNVSSLGRMMHDALKWSPAAALDNSGKTLPTRGSTFILTADATLTTDCATCHSVNTTTFDGNGAGWKNAKYHASLTAAGVTQIQSCLDCHTANRPNDASTGSKVAAGDTPFFHSLNSQLSGLKNPNGGQGCHNCHDVSDAGTGTAKDAWKNGLYHHGPCTSDDATCTTPNAVGRFAAQASCNTCHDTPQTTDRPISGGLRTATSTTKNTTTFHITGTHAKDFTGPSGITITDPYTTGATVDLGTLGSGDCKMCHKPTEASSFSSATADQTKWKTTRKFHLSLASPTNSDSYGGSCKECHSAPGTTGVGLPASLSLSVVSHQPASTAGTSSAPAGTAFTGLTGCNITVATGVAQDGTGTLGECLGCHSQALGRLGGASPTWAGGTCETDTGFVSKGFNSAAITGSTTLKKVTAASPVSTTGTITVNWRMSHGSQQIQSAITVGGNHDCALCHVGYAGTVSAKSGLFHYARQNDIAGSSAFANFKTFDSGTNTGLTLTKCSDCHSIITTALNGTTAGVKGIVENGSGTSAIHMNHFASVIETATGSTISLNSMDCSKCHSEPNPSPNYTIISSAYTGETAWLNAYKDGKFHTKMTGYTVNNCTACHIIKKPAASTLRQNNVTYNGSSLSVPVQKFDHSFTGISASTDCATCHQVPAVPASSVYNDWAKTSGTAKAKFHNSVAVSTSCQTCHVGPEGTVPSASFNHASYTTGTCSGCHTPTVTKTSSVTSTLTASDWLGGTAVEHTTTANCVKCHYFDSSAAGVYTFKDMATPATTSPTMTFNNSGPTVTVAGSYTHTTVTASGAATTTFDCKTCHIKNGTLTAVAPPSSGAVRSYWQKTNYFHSDINWVISSSGAAVTPGSTTAQNIGSQNSCTTCHTDKTSGKNMHDNGNTAYPAGKCSVCHTMTWPLQANLTTWPKQSQTQAHFMYPAMCNNVAGKGNCTTNSTGTGTNCKNCH